MGILKSTTVNSSSSPTPQVPVDINLRQIERQEEFFRQEMATVSRWLTASILAVNGAGAIAAFNADQSGRRYWIAGVLFIAGVLCGLLSGVSIQEIYKRYSDTLSDAWDYQISLVSGKPIDVERQHRHQKQIAIISKFAWVPPLIGWVGGVLFVVGAAAMVFLGESQLGANVQRCESIQADMLSAHPQRRDDIDLFKALNCEPVAKGSFELPSDIAGGASSRQSLHKHP